MTLLFRVFQMLIRSLFKKKIEDVFKKTINSFRVLPTDLDYYLHMNNSKYFTYAETCRFDLMVRSNFLKLALKNGYTTPIAHQEVDFMKPLKLFQKFKVESLMKILDDKWFEFEHLFFSSEDIPLAKIKVRCVIKKKSKTIQTLQVLEELDELRKLD